MCFALIAVEEGEDPRTCPDDVQLKDKITRLNAEGLTAQTVKGEVISFLQASPVEFAEVLIPYVIPSLLKEAGK
jgi:hypothetical protein